MKLLFTLLLSLFLIPSSAYGAKKARPQFDLTSLLEAPDCWSMTSAQFEKKFKKGKLSGFRWITKDRTRAKMARQLYSSLPIELTFLNGSIPVEEAVLDFEEGRLSVITFSLYNRAESKGSAKSHLANLGPITKKLNKQLGHSPQRREANSQQGLLTEGSFWRSREGVALLEHNEGAQEGKPLEFIRLRIGSPNSKSSLVKAMQRARGGVANGSKLRKFVTSNDAGDVFIRDLPMVDQGNKGYCVVASAQRLFEYYGEGIDMHQLAEVAGSDPNRGTSSLQMAKELDQIDYRFKTRLNIIGMRQRGGFVKVKKQRNRYIIGKAVDEKAFLAAIRSSIDTGIPLLWSLQIGQFPEKPNLRPQTNGGHMRTIIGYNDKDKEIIFSDSWGAGHEFKKMAYSHAYRASSGLYQLKPTTR